MNRVCISLSNPGISGLRSISCEQSETLSRPGVKMFICENCMEEFDDDEMSEDWNICKHCYEEEEVATLLAMEII